MLSENYWIDVRILLHNGEDRKSQVEHSREALSFCGYPDCSIKMVQRKMDECKKRKKRVVPGNQKHVQEFTIDLE